eukprot:747895-Hanusia_phi.AAC.8
MTSKVFAGDFNILPQSSSYRLLTSGMPLLLPGPLAAHLPPPSLPHPCTQEEPSFFTIAILLDLSVFSSSSPLACSSSSH